MNETRNDNKINVFCNQVCGGKGTAKVYPMGLQETTLYPNATIVIANNPYM